MTILYLTWGETPRLSGVFKSQAIEQFISSSKECDKGKFVFVSGVPVLNSGLVREKYNYPKEIVQIKNNFLKHSIRYYVVPIFSPQPLILAGRWGFPLVHGVSHFFLRNIIIHEKPNVVHCRSYHATWAALKVRKRYHFNYKVIFDARGLWPEEIAFKKSKQAKGNAYEYWKKIERYLLKHSDIIIAVSDPMKNHLQRLGGNDVRRVFLSASFNGLCSKYEPRQLDRPIILCYVGALAEGTWHRPESLAMLYKVFRRCFKSTKLIIATTSPYDFLAKYFSEYEPDEIVVTTTKNTNELQSILSVADFGCMPFYIPCTTIEKIVAPCVFATKTVEYLSAGKPMLVNKYCGGASTVVEENKVGIAYDPLNFKEISREKLKALMTKDVADRAMHIASENFDYHVNAIRYISIYKELSNDE